MSDEDDHPWCLIQRRGVGTGVRSGRESGKGREGDEGRQQRRQLYYLPEATLVHTTFYLLLYMSP
eukprot:3483452-Prymnesium_polylepis.1